MKHLATFFFLIFSQYLLSQSCEKALASPVFYVIDGVEWKLTPLSGDDNFRSFILQTKSWNYAREFSMTKSDKVGDHQLMLMPLDQKHEYYVGFDNCDAECTGYSRFNRIYIYDGSQLRSPKIGTLLCME